ncbi:Crp/Fnr family transcriptional regulator [Sphingomonas baiyangensis]|uniref:Crp/Fnr family transcriptional regulator n=1 Tax=Sphingomonas baiyangensis TaxID=2572576 RepID=A0A4U1L869_9SPHN|nr:Crp/Fnr family transcriptional regulator [Sphingomonas baiyangensis]TKD53147.1 Crp/Fnr family transcriptional regulator [Sphingomonas baiyangensis]
MSAEPAATSAVPAACAECPVRDEAICAVLDPAALDRLARAGRHRRVARGETIFAAGDDSIVCATLVEGAAKLSLTDAAGIERIVALVHPAGMLGRLFAPQMRYDAVALTDSRLCVFARAEFETLMADEPALVRAVLDRTLADLDAARELADLIGRREARGRVAGLLLAFARAAGPGCHPLVCFDLPLSRGEIAGLTGLTIETVSRQFSALEAAGLVRRIGARGIELVDPARLRSLTA